MTRRLLQRLAATFLGRVYRHRSATLGNLIGRELFEDVFESGVSERFRLRATARQLAVNVSGKIHNPLRIRRNDSVCGRPPAGLEMTLPRSGTSLSEGPIAEPQIGCEVKILAKSFQKQIDRVVNDLVGFRERMRVRNPQCINVAVIAVNHEPAYVSYESDRSYADPPRPGEVALITTKIMNEVGPAYDEILLIPFRATNSDPFPFSVVHEDAVRVDYGAVLTRIGAKYDSRFP